MKKKDAHADYAGDFTYSYFKKILNAAKSKFEVCLFSHAPQIVGELKSPTILLRHDVDVSLERALTMARIEKDYGVRATYMVMTESLLYDIEDDTSRDILEKIIRLGHEIGLHIDPSRRKATGVLDTRIESACRKLEHAISSVVSSFSFHKPPGEEIKRWKNELLIGDRVNAYAEALTGVRVGNSLERYRTDSRGQWKHGEPLSWFNEPDLFLRQLLIHPIWWGRKQMSAQERLQAYVSDCTCNYAKELREGIIKTIFVEFELGNSACIKKRDERA